MESIDGRREETAHNSKFEYINNPGFHAVINQCSTSHCGRDKIISRIAGLLTSTVREMTVATALYA